LKLLFFINLGKYFCTDINCADDKQPGSYFYNYGFFQTIFFVFHFSASEFLSCLAAIIIMSAGYMCDPDAGSYY